MPVYPLSDDNEIGAALNVARNPDPMGDTIQAKIGGLNQALTGLDLEANTPQFNTGIGGAGMPSGIRAYQGGPHSVGPEGYDNSKIGTGEGQQAFGYGHYFAEAEPVATTYRGDPEARYRRLSGHMDPKEEFAFDIATKPNVRDWDVIQSLAQKYPNIGFDEAQSLANKAMAQRGHMHEVNINAHPDHFLDWDRDVSEQHPHVLNAINNLIPKDEERRGGLREFSENPDDYAGGAIIQYLHEAYGPKKTSEMLHSAGIPGIRYLDAGSRNAGSGASNYVVFDPKNIEIMRRYARGGDVRVHHKKGGRTLGNNAIDNALRLATGGRAHFDDGGDAGGDVRGGDNPGGYSGDTGRFSGNQDAANNFRMGDSPGSFGGDTGRYSSHDVGAEQGAINAQTARDQNNQQNERQAQQNNPEGYSVRTNDVPGGLGGDTGRYNGPTNQAEAQQNFAAAVLQGNIQRARQQQQQAFDKYMNQIQGPESGGQGSAYNAQTGAFGAYQLMPSTALGLMQKYAPGETYRQALGTSNPADVAAGGLNAGPGYVGLTPQEQLRDVTLNQDLQRTLAEGLTRDNMATLSSAGVPINSGSLYTAHLLGAGDALKVLQSDPNTPLSQTGINPQAISNNKLEGMTAGQLLARSGSQMAATPASGVSSAGGYGRLAENVTDNSGARITDATASPDAAVTAAKAAATAQQPSIFDKIFGSTQDQIDKLAAQGQYSGMDKQQYADKFANGDPNAVKERIIYDNGQPKVDYYTKDLTQALFGDPLKALQTGISGLFKPSTSDNGFRSSVTQPTDNAAPTYGGHGGQQAINQAIAVAQPQQVAAPAPYIAQLGNYNSQLPSTTGQTAEQWAAANTGGDMSRVNGRIKYVNGAPMLEFYSA